MELEKELLETRYLLSLCPYFLKSQWVQPFGTPGRGPGTRYCVV